MNKQKQLKVGSLVRYTGTLDPQPPDVERRDLYGVVCKYPSRGDWIVEVHWYDDEQTWVFIGNLEVLA